MNLAYFPVINASLNGVSAVLLLFGYAFIRSGRYVAHATMMIAALLTSTAFLACYLTYHALRARAGIAVTQFPASHLRSTYYAILISHSILAALIVPLVLVTVWRAARRRWPWHRRIAYLTLPLWLYVSVTGVIIYWMLYHVAPRLGR